jgi:hypothetical protein
MDVYVPGIGGLSNCIFQICAAIFYDKIFRVVNNDLIL